MKMTKIKGMFDAFLTIFPYVLFMVEIGPWNSNSYHGLNRDKNNLGLSYFGALGLEPHCQHG